MSGNADALSIFSGLGGLDLGARIAGFHVQLATDSDAGALACLSAASGAATLAGDIDELLQGPLSGAWGDRDSPRVLIGGPPCTAFSHAGFWLDDKREGKDPAAELLKSYLRCLALARPAGFVLENVPGLAFKTHERFYRELVDGARRQGYAVSTALLKASDFGVAQARQRLFVVGIRGKRQVSLDHWPRFPQRGARWAIGDLEQAGNSEPDEHVGGKYAHLLPLVPPGGNYLHFTEPRGWSPPLFRYRGRYWSFLLKLHPDRPSPTLPAQRVTYNGPFHWENRRLRVREIARLQVFPDWYPLGSELPAARRRLGNAVPPLLSAVVLWRLREALGDVIASDCPEALRLAADPGASIQDVLDAYPRSSKADVSSVSPPPAAA